MNEYLESVKEFHDTFEHPVGTLDTPESLKIRQLRIKLLFEELAELAEASDCRRTLAVLCDSYCVSLAEIHGGLERTKEEFTEQVNEILDARDIQDGDNVNRKEELDALCDIQYVLSGKILTGGYHPIFDKNFAIVHANNMTKAHRSVEHCQETILRNNMENTQIIPKGDVFILHNSHGKLTKPWDHQKVALEL